MSDVLEQMRQLSGRMYVDGAYRRSRATVVEEILDPATEAPVGAYAEMPLPELDEVIGVANHAQRAWRSRTPLVRASLLHEVATRLEQRRAAIAEALTREMGKPYKESVDEVGWCVHNLRYYAELGRHETGRVAGASAEQQLHYTLKQPLGTAVLILPYNYPLVLLAWQASAAIASGNAVIVKPSVHTSLTTLMFAAAFDPLPAGLFNVVTGSAQVGRHLVAHEHTHMVAFTGSVPVGTGVARTCGELMKRCLIETSGNDPFIVMPSAPVEIAARAAAFAAHMNCGQVCTSAERFLVHDAIHEEFVSALVAHTRALRIGNGLDSVDIGPMVSARERERFEGIVQQARAEGARALQGGGRPPALERGWFVEPTVLVDCNPEMKILNNESFGPIAPVCRVASFEEAIELANRSQHGLGATLYTRDLAEALTATEQLEAGMVWVNAPLLDNDAMPFGGTKKSGLGRQLGAEGLETFRESKTVMIDPLCAPHDFWWFPYAQSEMYSRTS